MINKLHVNIDTETQSKSTYKGKVENTHSESNVKQCSGRRHKPPNPICGAK